MGLKNSTCTVKGVSESSNVNGLHIPVQPLNDNDNDNEEPPRCEVAVFLPPFAGGNPNKKTLVLDLDGTLVHTSKTPMPVGYHYSVTFEGRDTPSYYVLKRPGVDELLQQLGATGLYEIVLFTAASKQYADAVVDRLLDLLPVTDSTHFIRNTNIIPATHRLYGDHCREVEDVPDDVKDLSLLGRDLKNVIFVDDRPSSYCLQPRNAIPIDCWSGMDFNDRSLFNILYFCLLNADSALDVRELIHSFLRFGKTY